MEKCSYRWEQRDERKGDIEVQCSEEIWSGSEKHCIFHDSSQEKNVNLFMEKLKEQIESETERYNFIGSQNV